MEAGFLSFPGSDLISFPVMFVYFFILANSTFAMWSSSLDEEVGDRLPKLIWTFVIWFTGSRLGAFLGAGLDEIDYIEPLTWSALIYIFIKYFQRAVKEEKNG